MMVIDQPAITTSCFQPSYAPGRHRTGDLLIDFDSSAFATLQSGTESQQLQNEHVNSDGYEQAIAYPEMASEVHHSVSAA
ncbi:hypothetical protein [Sphingomonas sp. PP-CC-3A-396]|uniref:hypothetical protein n=1 Tax=Sphingomonas sp. PP-CC-3A-396 TaxID=2135655 RepID=UPI00104E21ED|nr:hypothetical protein [Sphingomonas sp. PP-CC-3A-396]